MSCRAGQDLGECLGEPIGPRSGERPTDVERRDALSVSQAVSDGRRPASAIALRLATRWRERTDPPRTQPEHAEVPLGPALDDRPGRRHAIGSRLPHPPTDRTATAWRRRPPPSVTTSMPVNTWRRPNASRPSPVTADETPYATSIASLVAATARYASGSDNGSGSQPAAASHDMPSAATAATAARTARRGAPRRPTRTTNAATGRKAATTHVPGPPPGRVEPATPGRSCPDSRPAPPAPATSVGTNGNNRAAATTTADRMRERPRPRDTGDHLHDHQERDRECGARQEGDEHRDRDAGAGDEPPASVRGFLGGERRLDPLQDRRQNRQRHQEPQVSLGERPQDEPADEVGGGSEHRRPGTPRQPDRGSIREDRRQRRRGGEQHLLCERRAAQRQPREPAEGPQGRARRQRPPSRVVGRRRRARTRSPRADRETPGSGPRPAARDRTTHGSPPHRRGLEERPHDHGVGSDQRRGAIAEPPGRGLVHVGVVDRALLLEDPSGALEPAGQTQAGGLHEPAELAVLDRTLPLDATSAGPRATEVCDVPSPGRQHVVRLLEPTGQRQVEQTEETENEGQRHRRGRARRSS